MTDNSSVLGPLWDSLTNRRKKQAGLLLSLMILASLMEIISIGAVLPFLGALTTPETIYENELLEPVFSLLSIQSPNDLAIPLTIVFIAAILMAAIVRLMLLYVSTRFSYAVGADLSIEIYRRTLYQDYSVHMARNSSEVINGIITKTNTVIGQVLVPLTLLISSLVIMFGIISMILVINAPVALGTFGFFGFFYWLIVAVSKKSLSKNGQLIAEQSTKMVKSLQEGLGGIRDVLIDSTQEFFSEIYRAADLRMRRAAGDNLFIRTAPRYVMEGVGMILIAAVALVLSLQEGGIDNAIPVLGALALGAQRLLPIVQQGYNSYTSIKGAQASFIDVLELLRQPLRHPADENTNQTFQFNEGITLEDVSFRYSQSHPLVLKNISLSFRKGETIGFVGETGAGKSTLLDILMGLLTPSEGKLLVDGVQVSSENRVSWMSNIAHVPQSIYLSDSTLEENIAFGIKTEKIDVEKVRTASQKAQISSFVNNLRNGFHTLVGERGTKLSGGQRQRIGIARALYKDNSVLIMDEATSALDSATERKIMEQIAELKTNQTIFIIAHRITTLKGCDRIIRINRDNSVEELTYQDIAREHEHLG